MFCAVERVGGGRLLCSTTQHVDVTTSDQNCKLLTETINSNSKSTICFSNDTLLLIQKGNRAF